MNQCNLYINRQILLVQHLQEALRIEQAKLGNMLRESLSALKGGGNKGSGKGGNCWTCGKPGHQSRDCWHRQKGGKGEKGEKGGADGNGGKGFGKALS